MLPGSKGFESVHQVRNFDLILPVCRLPWLPYPARARIEIYLIHNRMMDGLSILSAQKGAEPFDF